MRTWMLTCAAVAVAGFWAVPAPAQESYQTPTPAASSPTQTVPMAQQRTGLFGRLRGRRQMTVASQPDGMAPTTITTMPKLSPVLPAQGTQTPSGVQQAQYPPIEGGVKQTQATMPASTPMPASATTMQMAEPRQGLLMRLRSRLGR